MAYKSILVSVDNLPEADALVETAASLARRIEATLIGVAAAAPRVLVDPYGTIAVEAMADERAEIESRLRSAEAIFRTQAAAAGVASEWRTAITFPATAVNQAASAADVIILGRPAPETEQDTNYRVSPGEILMGAGRPILVLPPDTRSLNLRDIIVAWKDTREARRAVSDALPLLRLAETVMVLAFRSGPDDDASVARIEAFLKRHAVPAKAETNVVPHARVEEELYRFASVAGSSLIVAGGYGHSRLREWMFGGVTKALLEGSPIPVFLSH